MFTAKYEVIRLQGRPRFCWNHLQRNKRKTMDKKVPAAHIRDIEYIYIYYYDSIVYIIIIIIIVIFIIV